VGIRGRAAFPDGKKTVKGHLLPRGKEAWCENKPEKRRERRCRGKTASKFMAISPREAGCREIKTLLAKQRLGKGAILRVKSVKKEGRLTVSES